MRRIFLSLAVMLLLSVPATEAAASARDDLEKGIIARNLGFTKLALHYFTRATMRYDTNDELVARILNNRSVTFLQLGNLERAAADLDTVLTTDPNLIPAYYNRGQIRLSQRLYKSAIDDFNAFLDLNGEHPLALYSRGLAHWRTGAQKDAIQDIRSAYALAPNHKVIRAAMIKLGFVEPPPKPEDTSPPKPIFKTDKPITDFEETN